MIATWLQTTVRPGDPEPFIVWDVTEVEVEREALIAALADELIKAHFTPGYIERVAARAGVAAAGKLVAKHVLPTARATCTGNFGEVIAAALLRDRDGLRIPLPKLRYREKQEWAMRLTDILAFDGPQSPAIDEAWFVEVKTRLARDPRAGCDGHESLRKECSAERPEIFTFIAQRLFELGRLDECDAMEDFLADPQNPDRRRHLLTLVFDPNVWHQDVLNRLTNLPPTLKPFRVEVVLVSGLKALIDESYAAARAKCVGPS